MGTLHWPYFKTNKFKIIITLYKENFFEKIAKIYHRNSKTIFSLNKILLLKLKTWWTSKDLICKELFLNILPNTSSGSKKSNCSHRDLRLGLAHTGCKAFEWEGVKGYRAKAEDRRVEVDTKWPRIAYLSILVIFLLSISRPLF